MPPILTWSEKFTRYRASPTENVFAPASHISGRVLLALAVKCLEMRANFRSLDGNREGGSKDQNIAEGWGVGQVLFVARLQLVLRNSGSAACPREAKRLINKAQTESFVRLS